MQTNTSNVEVGFDHMTFDALEQPVDIMQALAEATQHDTLEQEGGGAVWEWGPDNVEADSDARTVIGTPPSRECVPSAAALTGAPLLDLPHGMLQQHMPEMAWHQGQKRPLDPIPNGLKSSTNCRIGEEKYALSRMTDSSGSALFDYDDPNPAPRKTSRSRGRANLLGSSDEAMLTDLEAMKPSSDDEMLTDVEESDTYFESSWLRDSTCPVIAPLLNTLKFI